jgi:hypothetical protein
MQKAFTGLAATGGAAGPADAGAGHVWRQVKLRVKSNVANAVVALETSPDNAAWTEVARYTGGNGWSEASTNATGRYLRPNVVNLGTGGAGRSDAGCGTTNGSVTVTDAAAVAADLNKGITGPGIPAGTAILGVTVGVGYTLSQAATATASALTFVVGLQPVNAIVTGYLV